MPVLFVSKPIVPPFNDGSKCLVSALCSGLQRNPAQVLGVAGAEFELPNTEVLPIHRAGGAFSPSLAENARALGYLLRERQATLWHFVFAPNPRASRAIRWVRRIRRTPALQTIASPPRNFDGVDALLFGDVVVAQSEWTKKRIEAGLHKEREIHVIPPPLGDVADPDPAAEQSIREQLDIPATAPVVVYPGDLEFSGGAERFAKLAEGYCGAAKDLVFVFACRRKTDQALGVERSLQSRLNPARVRFAGELKSLLPLLKTACCVAFPVEELWGKVDIPIALLEAAQLGTPLIVADSGPAGEIGGAVALALDDTRSWLAHIERFVASGDDYAQVVNAQLLGLDATNRKALVAARYENLYEQLLT